MERFIQGFLIGAIITMLIVGIFVKPEWKEKGYQQGQIDALTGNIQYELITHPDSTRTWERIEP